jgi:serine-type D-Ala-D-Ala carboxypeptidase/endopeptidase (penicillin-binding protein 4)
MGWGQRAGSVASALLVIAGGGAAVAFTTGPSPDPSAATHQIATHRAGHPGRTVAHRTSSVVPTKITASATDKRRATTTARPIRATTTTLRGAFTDASDANPYVAALAQRLAPVVETSPGCLVVTQGRTMLYSSHPTSPVIPGSTQKLLVAAAALDVLGPNYTFTTKVVAPAEPVNGVVSDLWLVGGGDPLLEEPAFNAWWAGQPRYLGDPYTNVDTLASEVRANAVTTVTGGIHGDDARYDAVRFNPNWSADLASGNINPMSALTLDMGFETWLSGPAIIPTDPASFAAASFAQLLGSAGVKAAGNPRAADGAPPAGSVTIATIHSPPLTQIIGAMLRPSDNQIAELMVKELGYHATGLGTTAAGLRVVRSVDTRLGIPWKGTSMVDGSGLSNSDRTTCRTLLAVLYLGDKHRFSAIPEGLSVAGVDGTLAERFLTPPLRGHIVAKTGSVDGAAGMVGEVELGKPVRFAMVFNQPVSDSVLLGDEDNAINAIVPYP